MNFRPNNYHGVWLRNFTIDHQCVLYGLDTGFVVKGVSMHSCGIGIALMREAKIGDLNGISPEVNYCAFKHAVLSEEKMLNIGAVGVVVVN